MVMIKMNFKKKFLIIFYICLLFSIGFFVMEIYNNSFDKNNNKNIMEDNLPGVTGPGTNTISYGLYKDDELLENHEQKFSGKEKLTLSLSNFVGFSREYVIVALLDYIQTEIEVNGKSTRTYKFSVGENETKNIPFIIDIPEDTHEFSLLVFKDPNFVELDNESYNSLSSLEEVIALRFNLNGNNKIIPETMKAEGEKSSLPIVPLFLSSTYDELKIVTEHFNNDTLYLFSGEYEISNEKEQAIIVFNDWEQISLNDNMVNYLETTNKMKYYPLNFTNKGIYQIVSFPEPFNVSNNNRESQRVYSSFRFYSY
jgi:hypothetical protein